MNESQRFYFESHLKVLYNLFRFLGLIHFKFNPSTRRFEHSRVLSAISMVTYNLVWYAYSFCVISKIGNSLKAYQRDEKSYNGFSSIVAQDDLLMKLNTLREYLSLVLFVRSYIRHRKRLLPVINEIADILTNIQSRTNPRLYVHSCLVKVLVFKLIIVCNHTRKVVLVLLPLTILVFHFIWIFALAIPILTFGSHVYCQLALISAYTKMNELLASVNSDVKCQSNPKLVRELLNISHRIHRVKKKLNEIHTPILVATIMGSLYDICQMYITLEALIYAKYIKSIQSLWHFMHSVKFPECISYSFDMYLIGLLSDTLMKTEDEFQNLVMDMTGDTRSMRMDVGVMLMKRNVLGLGTSFHGGIRVDQQYAFDFCINVVLAIALTCLQFYAAEVIYATSSGTFAEKPVLLD